MSHSSILEDNHTQGKASFFECDNNWIINLEKIWYISPYKTNDGENKIRLYFSEKDFLSISVEYFLQNVKPYLNIINS